ncbi:MAG TPA: hypothetical protein VGD06_14535 [Acidobacteriota bacterium]
MARIDFRIGRRTYRLEADGHCWTLARVEVVQGGKTAGTERLADSTYHVSIESALAHAYELGLRESGVSTLDELREEARRLRRDIRAAFAMEAAA